MYLLRGVEYRQLVYCLSDWGNIYFPAHCAGVTSMSSGYNLSSPAEDISQTSALWGLLQHQSKKTTDLIAVVMVAAGVLCCGYMWNEIVSKLFQPSSTSDWNDFKFGVWKLAWNYFRIISEAYCSSRIFPNMSNVAEIMLKKFQRPK